MHLILYGDLPENGDTDIPQRTDILKRNFRTLARDDIFDYNNMEYNKRDVGSSPHPTNNKPRTSSGNQNEPTNLPPKIILVSFESITLETESKSDPLKTKHNLVQNDEYAPPTNPKKQENNSDTDDESNKTTKSSPSRDGGNIGVYENFSKAFLRNLDTNHQQNTNPEVKKQENGVQPQRTENEAGIQMETRPSSYLAHSSDNEKNVLKVFGNKVNGMSIIYKELSLFYSFHYFH
ncbi:hypothetical protein AX774_g3884 [Zancudomyces culisetae]|uniref:Uncharacterized protein n=1 Tax=Zancudomyces culisetae TaxID=1213189 RepID=A0A1R1PNT3_ZANCU|nr:hypothetical protein AX774_g3884 [Zancudomyces culisetae]|eukprot:OMH82635.1 hypothetical protein AX774_g3884 [Zancudomyces culisetae]